MSEFFVKIVRNIRMENAVLIEGLPGIGNVARLSADYLIDKLNATKFLEIYSDVFPNSVMINEDSLIKMFTVEFYHTKINGRDVIILSGDVQPSSDAESYALCNEIIKIAKKLNVSEIITIGGIGLPESPQKPAVHAVANDESVIKELEKLNVVLDGNETVKIILGATGLLLGIAGIRGIKGFSLLAETINDPRKVGINEAKEVLKVLTRHLDFELDFKDLDEEISNYRKLIKNEKKLRLGKQKIERQGYIG